MNDEVTSHSRHPEVSINVHLFSALSPKDRHELQQRLARYYQNPPPEYHRMSDRAASQYTLGEQPFHCDLVGRVESGMAVLEVGCGSAHLCPFVESAGASYTGIDHSHSLLEENRRKFPNAVFCRVEDNLPQTFDIVASLYTIEHVVDPPCYLQKLWDFCRPGGLLGIICPDFVDGESLPPSFYYGNTPRRFRAKLARFALSDLLGHLRDLIVLAPRWKKQARAMHPGAFWINIAPRILFGAEYTVDSDAVHLPRLQDLVWWLQGRGAKVLETSRSLPGVREIVLRHNCYVLARKPA